jgi:ABC-type Fe3+-hydroxamate transport system substrate-binding protein
MLGAGDKIVATVLTPASVPWLYTIDPALRQAQTVFTNTTVNAEALAQTHPDVLFADKSTQIAAGGRNAAQISGNARPVSTEQVAQWNPDVIILASSAFAVADPGQQTLEI